MVVEQRNKHFRPVSSEVYAEIILFLFFFFNLDFSCGRFWVGYGLGRESGVVYVEIWLKFLSEVNCVYYSVERLKKLITCLYLKFFRLHMGHCILVWAPHYKRDIGRVEELQPRGHQDGLGLSI